MTNKVFKRVNEIANGNNTDSSDEYYTLFHAFASILIEVLCRFNKGIKYKVIICPCDSQTSVFRKLEEYKDLIGNPKIIYSFYPENDWKDYFCMDYQKEFGCDADEVLILTNPPFKGLSKCLRNICCDYLLFGSNCVAIKKGVYVKETGGFIYIKNNNTFTGNADEFQSKYGSVCTFFYSNKEFLSFGNQYTNKKDNAQSILFGKNELEKIK